MPPKTGRPSPPGSNNSSQFSPDGSPQFGGEGGIWDRYGGSPPADLTSHDDFEEGEEEEHSAEDGEEEELYEREFEDHGEYPTRLTSYPVGAIFARLDAPEGLPAEPSDRALATAIERALPEGAGRVWANSAPGSIRGWELVILRGSGSRGLPPPDEGALEQALRGLNWSSLLQRAMSASDPNESDTISNEQVQALVEENESLLQENQALRAELRRRETERRPSLVTGLLKKAHDSGEPSALIRLEKERLKLQDLAADLDARMQQWSQ